ncbi:SEL1-like repeat protein [Eikenella halliae]|nr:SEL1-like repeat protein [Eikenella halliae]
MYEQGRGIPRDLVKALALYQQAASLDHVGSKTKLRQLMN